MPEWRSELIERLRGLALAPEREAEIVEELSVHLEERFAELALTHPPDDAKRLALAELDAREALADRLSRLRQARESRRALPPAGAPRRRLLSDLGQDLRYAVRLLRRQRGFTAAAVATLALGIGANTAIFSLIDGMLFRPLGVSSPETLHYVGLGRPTGSYSYPAYADARDRNDVLEGLAAFGPITATIGADTATDLAAGVIVSGNFFSVLGVEPGRGRLLTETDDRTPMAHPVAVISHGLWQRRFGGDDDVVGREVLLNGHRFTIVGVTPAAFGGPDLTGTYDLYVPMMMQPLMRPPRAGFSGDMDPNLLTRRDMSWLLAVGRLAPGVTRETAEAALSATVTSLWREANPTADERVIEMPLTPIAAGAFDQRAAMSSVARLLLMVVGAVLLIGCANVANLLLARATARQSEVAMRLAVGASRGRLVRQLLTESLVLSLAGGAVGVLLAWVAIRAFQAVPPPPGALPVTLEFAADLRVLAFAVGLSLATGVIFGLLPAFRTARSSLVPAIKSDATGRQQGPGGRRRRLTLGKGLVVVEVALSLLLLITAGLFVRSLRASQAVDPAFDADRLVTAPLNVNLLRYTREQGSLFYANAIESAEALPGVEAAAVARVPVLSGAARSLAIEIEGQPTVEDVRNVVLANVVSDRFFETLGVPVRRGRAFTVADVAGAPPVVVVNQTLADRYFAGNAAGARIKVVGGEEPWREIVGVVADSKYVAVNQPDAPTVYFPLAQNHETGVTLYVRAAGDPGALIGPVRDALRTLEPNLPATDVGLVTDAMAAALYAARMGAALLAVLAALALVLAAVGVYGVMAFSTARRTHEMGVRVALGADTRAVLGLVVREGLMLVAVGVGLGLIGAAFAARAIQSLLFGIEPIDAPTFVLVPLVLAGVAVAACLVPAWRATQVDPTTALRSV